MNIGLHEIVGIAMTGILSVLWWDIRGIRKEREEQTKLMEDTYLKKETHDLLCKNAGLEFKNHVSQEIKVMRDEILTAIKNNGRG